MSLTPILRLKTEWPEQYVFTPQTYDKHTLNVADHSRLAFYRLLRAINVYCFDALLKLPAQQFKLIMDSIVWGTKHTMRDIADIALT